LNDRIGIVTEKTVKTGCPPTERKNIFDSFSVELNSGLKLRLLPTDCDGRATKRDWLAVKGVKKEVKGAGPEACLFLRKSQLVGRRSLSIIFRMKMILERKSMEMQSLQWEDSK